MASIENVSPSAKATSPSATSRMAIVSSEHRSEHPFRLREASNGGNGLCWDATGHSWDALRAQSYDDRGCQISTPHCTHCANGIIVMAVWSIVHFKVLPNYKIEIRFADDTFGIADLSPRLSQGPVGDGFDPLCDEATFCQVVVEHGALTWPGDINLAPDAMYQRIRSTGTSLLATESRPVA